MTLSRLPVDQNERALTLDTRHSFLVQAPAGSGKTELLIRRLLKLLAEVDEPEQILAITFTLAATAEMRARVLTALQHAAAGTHGDREDVQLAHAALANDRTRGWNLLQQPERLNIQTIDAVCLRIAHGMPLLSRLGGSLSPTDKPQPLYTLAARRTLARLGGDPELSSALRALLQLRATSLPDCQRLIADMLDKRDQWGELLLGAGVDWSVVRDYLEAPLRREQQQALKKAQSLFALYPDLANELVEILSQACGNLEPGSKLLALQHVSAIRDLTSYNHWRCLCDFLLTKGGEWRKRASDEIGFISGKLGKAAKDRFLSLIGQLEREAGFLSILRELRDLPPEKYNEEDWQMLQHMLVILRHAIAQLRVIFAERGVVDFVELGLAAREVLSNDKGEPGEQAAAIAERWPHLLVDEFQDTSRSQYELLTLLVGGWESAGRGSCFLVGDPMQSIYMFRQAEVELFERTRRHGLGNGTAAIKLAPLQLQTNFRSHAGLVERLNTIFAAVFANDAGGDDYQVSFAESTASRPAPEGAPGVRIWPFFRSSKPDPGERRSVEDAEARQVVSIIQGYSAEMERAKKCKEPFKIAVLVRARTHLGLITRRLRKAKIPFRAVEIEQLGERQEVRDLTALTRALLHPLDRIAWLTVLRAPWCGLTLKDLHTLCGNDDKAYAWRPILTLLREGLPLLSADGQLRAARVHAVLEDAVRGKHRQVSLAQWIERCWLTLGGRACVDLAGYENVRAFFTMLEELGPDAEGLEERITELCAQPDPLADENCGVQLMTIHKAKGLGFDIVIVPGLERETRPDAQPLLRSLERTRLVGEREEEEHEFVVAPIGRNGESEGIYDWIGKQQSRREDDEARRLLYVAATRAGTELHLLGTAIIKKDSRELSAGPSQSLLAIAWPAIADEYERAYQDFTPAALEQQRELPFPPSVQLRRLPADWEPPRPAVAPETEESFEIVERPRGSLSARAFGTVVHALLEELAGIDAAEALAQVADWRPRALAMLRASGLPGAEAEAQSAEAVRALTAVLKDATGRWILGARAGASTEVSWSAWAATEGVGETVRSLRGDRIFRAGATPGSTEETHLWIVDYKTASHGASGLDTFLEGEKAKYRQQLEAYAGVMRKVQGENLPICLALYYPLLSRLVWW